MGDPQKAFRVVHLTGTNGKTSTTRMVERLLREHGLSTGRFTSPHLREVTERITMDGAARSRSGFVEVYEEVLPYVDIVDARSAEQGEPRMTFFEVLVAMAFAAFADAPVDVAVVEVGLGGSWDATNVADGQVAVITPIALDHQRCLGHDVADIARRRPGSSSPAASWSSVYSPWRPPRCCCAGLPRWGRAWPARGWSSGWSSAPSPSAGSTSCLQGLGGSYDEVFLPLHGEHQAHNAACALAAVEALLGGEGGLDADTVRAALADVDSPGRLELVRRSPAVLVDAAHNPAGAAVLADAVQEAFSFQPLVGVVGVLADKDAAGILAALEPVLDAVVVTRASSPRAVPVEELQELAVEIFGEDRVDATGRLEEALDMALARAETDGRMSGGVLVTGSVTMAAQARVLLGRR